MSVSRFSNRACFGEHKDLPYGKKSENEYQTSTCSEHISMGLYHPPWLGLRPLSGSVDHVWMLLSGQCSHARATGWWLEATSRRCFHSVYEKTSSPEWSDFKKRCRFLLILDHCSLFITELTLVLCH